MMIRIKKIAAFAVLLIFFLSCDQNREDKADQAVQDTSVKTVQPLPQPGDSVVTKLRPALINIETTDLQYGGNKVSGITISDIKYKFISLKEYYGEQKKSLAGLVKLSGNKEKTQKALAWLDKMMKKPNNEPEVYQVQFHLVAQVAKFNYDETQTLFLKKDLSKLQLVFPD